ncbi:hypothetical protein MF672_037890 [Actinomadura sp. ATCC 31491]|uniref:Cyanovirin-N domain-containing protein n=1 Tax=Actinomadura luzonensis TaxID=2805427 RepID=A0ABT0G4U7_9ACTN|nr:hypothetical protein [Actinomadura luzonensis]MCK2219524.1 hypothetical protein [Actinomadura luzonensis]
MNRLVTSAAVLALTAALVPAAAAQAAGIPVYTCHTLGGDPATTRLVGDCEATPGAVLHGDFAGEAIGQIRISPLRIHCTGGGQADVPDHVVLRDCTQIG